MSDHDCDARLCDVHPHCPFCGGVQVDEGDRARCVNCGTVTPIANPAPTEASS